MSVFTRVPQYPNLKKGWLQEKMYIPPLPVPQVWNKTNHSLLEGRGKAINKGKTKSKNRGLINN